MTTRTLPERRPSTSAVSSHDTVNWRLRGSCRSEDPELFFSKSIEDREEAKRICAGCPVQAQCTDLAIEHQATAGVWGGSEHFTTTRSYGASHLPVVQDILLNRRTELNAAIAEGLAEKVLAEKFRTNVQTVRSVLAALDSGEVDWQQDEPDADTVRRYLAGEVREVHPRDRLAAVAQGVREGLTYAHFDRLYGLRAHATEEFIRKARKVFASAGVEFPDMGRQIAGPRLLAAVQVVEMRELSVVGVPDKELAFRFDVALKTVRAVLSGRSYRGAGGPLRASGVAGCPAGGARPVVGQQDLGAAA